MSDSSQGASSHPLASALDQANAQFDATSKAVTRMDKVRKVLAQLAKQGSAVTPEDVIQGAGKLVAGGEDPVGLASLMADMPTNGGDALASWVAMHEQQTAQKEAQLAQVHEAARHQLAVSSVHELVRHSMGAGAAPPQNALAPQGPTSPAPSAPAGPNALAPQGA